MKRTKMTIFHIVKRQIVPPGLAIYIRLWGSLVLRRWGPCKSIKDKHDNKKTGVVAVANI